LQSIGGLLVAGDEFVSDAARILGREWRHSRNFDGNQLSVEFDHRIAARRRDQVAYFAGDFEHGQQQSGRWHRLRL
jgi:hypothetical protein